MAAKTENTRQSIPTLPEVEKKDHSIKAVTAAAECAVCHDFRLPSGLDMRLSAIRHSATGGCFYCNILLQAVHRLHNEGKSAAGLLESTDEDAGITVIYEAPWPRLQVALNARREQKVELFRLPGMLVHTWRSRD